MNRLRSRITPPTHVGDEGSALVIALVMVFIIGVIAVSVMGYTSTSLRATESVTANRTDLYAADGGIDAAIQHIANVARTDPGSGIGYSDGSSCAFQVQAPGQEIVDVTCVGTTQASSQGVGDGGVNSTQPLFAIQTLGRRAASAGPPNINGFDDLLAWWGSGAAGEPGVVFSPNWSSQLAFWTLNEAGTARLKGGVFSNSTIVADTGALITDEGTTFTSRGACTVSRGGRIVVEGSSTNPNCEVIGYPTEAGGYAEDATGRGADPMYPSRIDLQGLPAKAPMPTCTGNLVTFEPGWYDSAAALTNIMRDCRGTDGRGADFWFQPGVYLFDFRDTSAAACGSGGGGRVRQWCIGEGSSNPRVVGGTPENWNPTPQAVTSAHAPSTVTSSTGLADAASGTAIDGVSATSGVFSGGATTLAPASVNVNPNSFANPTRAYGIQSGNVDDSIAARYNSGCTLWICATGQLTLRGYPTTVPAGATVASSTLRVRQRSNNTNIGALRVDVLNASGQQLCSRNLTPTTTANAPTETIDLGDCLTTAAQANGVQLRFVAQAAGTGILGGGTTQFFLDGIALDVQYGNPQPSLVVSGFGASVPPDASAYSATLTVEHDSSAATSPTITLGPGAGWCTLSLAGQTTLDVTSCLTPSSRVAELTATYRATLVNGQSVSIDGMRLDLAYTAATRAPFPAACAQDQPGVQFVFAGDSRVRFVDGTMNLCAGPAAGSFGQAGYTAQQIAIYGLRPLEPFSSTTVVSAGNGIANPNHAVIMSEQPVNEITRFTWSAPWNQARSSEPLILDLPGFAGASFPGLPQNTKVVGVTLRAQYNAFFDALGGLFGGNPNSPEVRFLKDGTPLCTNTGLAVSGWDTGVWSDATQQAVDVTSCFLTGGAVDLEKLTNLQVEWKARGTCAFLSFGGCNFQFDLDGFELELTLAPIDATQPAALPQQGCITAKPNYGRGNADSNDKSCAVMKWGPDSGNGSGVFFGSPNDPSAMVQINGTVYAPGAALDIAEYGLYCGQTRRSGLIAWLFGEYCPNDTKFAGVTYPVVDRGIIARHVRIRGLKIAPEYDGYLVGCGRDDCGSAQLPNPVLVTLQATVGSASGPRVEAQVCFGKVVDERTSDRDAETADGRYCAVDENWPVHQGTGPPVVVSWRDLSAAT